MEYLKKSDSLIGSNFFLYQKTVSNAESFILSEKYSEAIDEYNLLLKDYDYVFPRDMYIAAQVAAYTQNESEFLKFLESAILRGCSEKALLFNRYIKKGISRISRNKFNELYNENNKLYKQHIKLSLKEEIDRLFEVDRLFYKLHNRKSLFKKKKNVLPLWAVVSEMIGEKIEFFIKKEGFPSYRLIGVDTNQDFDLAVTSQLCIILLAHDFDSIPSINDLLFEEAVKGNLPVRGYAFLRDVVAYKRITKEKLKKDDFDNYRYASLQHMVGEYDEKAINKNREKIGLLSLELEIKKKTSDSMYLRKKNLKKNTKANFYFFSNQLF